MRPMLVVGLPWSQLARQIAAKCQAHFIPITVSHFADSEKNISFQTLNTLSGSDVLVVYQFAFAEKNNSINDQLIALFELIDLVKSMDARTIKLFLPYVPYSRQDQSFDKKHKGAVFMLGSCLKALGVSTLFACQLHEPSIATIFPLPLQHISLELFWQKIVKDLNLGNFCIVSPDEGGRERARALAALLNVSSAFIRKTRVAPDIARACELVGDVQGKTVILLDDIIDTARTAVAGCDLLLAQGAHKVYGFFVHAIFSSGAFDRLLDSKFEKVFVTDTVKSFGNKGESNKIITLSINDDLAQVLTLLH